MDALDDRFHLLREFSLSGKNAEKRELICLNELLAEFHERNRPDMEMGGQSFLLRQTKERLTIPGSRDGLWRVLENLCYNALSFTPKEGTITLILERAEGCAKISVADTGCGIAPDDLPFVFESGFSRRNGVSGDGLGLFIARSIVLEHGGDISVQSTQNIGTVFEIFLPLKK